MRVGLAGFAAGSIYHAPLIAAAGGELAAIATSNPGRRHQAEVEYPQAVIVPDLDALLTLDLDVVLLATPTALHHEHLLATIAAGRACVVEKPFTVTLEQARDVAAAATAAEVPVTVFQNRRFDDGHLTAARVLDENRVGTPYRFEFNWERWRPVPKNRWRENADWQAGGGLLLDLGPHLVDTALQLLGPAVAVYGEVRNRVTNADDDVFIAISHESGAISHLTGSTAAAVPNPRMRLLGRTGAWIYTDFEENATAYPGYVNADEQHCGWLLDGETRRPMPRGVGEPADYYRSVFAALKQPDYAARQAAMPVSLPEALAVMEVLDAARNPGNLLSQADRP